MSELIKIIKPTTQQFSINMGEKTADLLSRFTQLDEEEKETLITETSDILSKCINPIDTYGSITNIVVGYVQSGKTMSFTTLSALALDNGFRVIIYFAGVKNNLLTQTTERLRKDLIDSSSLIRYYKLFENPTPDANIPDFRDALQLTYKPAILITVLKHAQHIDNVSRIMNDRQVKQALGHNGVLIIDDEADQASLNTYALKNSKKEDWEDEDFSPIYSSILRLKASLDNHSYIQYTATPQGPLLINMLDLLSPKYHTVLTPGKKYTGGITFFNDNPSLIQEIPEEQVYHSSRDNEFNEPPLSLQDALQVYLLGVAIAVHKEGRLNFLSMMIHADTRTAASRKFQNWVIGLKDSWAKRLSLADNDPAKVALIAEFRKNYIDEAIRLVQNKHSFEEIIELMPNTIRDTKVHLVIQGTEKIDWRNNTSHILVGAEMLNRGFTVENLSVTYMPRHNKGKSTADTIQQRCRFFGYKQKYLDICRVYLPWVSAMEYRDYIEHEEMMRHKLLEFNTLDAVVEDKEFEQLLILDGNMNATRKNILSKDMAMSKLSGWRQMNALQSINENISIVESFLKNKNWINFESLPNFRRYSTEDRRHRYVKLDSTEVIAFLKDFKLPNVPDAKRKSATIEYLKHLVRKNGILSVYIIEMAYDGDARSRSIDNSTQPKIKQLFSGHANEGVDVYPGDRAFKFDDAICIQIHKLKIKQLNNQICYTLGIYYPEDFAINYISDDVIVQD